MPNEDHPCQHGAEEYATHQPLQIIRKIWTGMNVRRIQAVWMNHNTLHSSQNGFRWGQGTDTALLRIIDALEDAREFGTEARMTLWDLRRAFDSVSRNFLRLS
jgi:hypothetical protein